MADGDVLSRKYYVYVVFRLTGVPCYVGKGTGGRWRSHIAHSHNQYLRRIFTKAGGDLPIVKVRENLTNAEAIETEIAMIAAIGRCDLGLGPLVNLTDGGDGLSGHKQTDAHRRAIGLAQKGKPASPRKLAALNEARSKRRFDASSREKMRAAQIGKRQSLETVEKRAVRLRGRKRDPEMMERLRALNTGRQVSDETRQKIGATSRGRKQRPETLAKRKETMRDVYANTDYRSVLSEAIRLAWARRKSNGSQVGP